MPAKRTAYPVSATLRLQFPGYRIEVETNSLRLAARLQAYFSGYLGVQATPADAHLQAIVGVPDFDPSKMRIWARPSTPNRVPKESYYDIAGVRHILKNRTGVLISLSRSGGASIIGALEEHANQVINLIGTLFGLSLLAQGYVMVHASAIAHAGDGAALVFLGNSGSGKSSLALQLIERGGYDFLSNDRVLMRTEKGKVWVAGLPKKPRVNPGTLLASASLSRLVPRPRRRVYEQLPRKELWQLEEKTDVDIESHLGARSRLTAGLGRVYSLEWRSSGRGFAQRDLGALEALAALQTTSKDFGPYDLHGSDYDPSTEFRRIARLVPFVALSGRADPKGFAARLTKDAE